MIHTLQNLPTVSEGNKSNNKRRTDKNNLKKKKISVQMSLRTWHLRQKQKNNQWGHSEAVSAIPTTHIHR